MIEFWGSDQGYVPVKLCLTKLTLVNFLSEKGD